MVKVASPSSLSLSNQTLLGDNININSRAIDLSSTAMASSTSTDGVHAHAHARVVGEHIQQRSRSNSINSSERRRRHQARIFEKSRGTSIARMSPTPPVTSRKSLDGGGSSSPRHSDSEHFVNQSFHSSTSSSYVKGKSSSMSMDVTAEETTFSSSANNTPDNSFQIHVRKLPRSASSSPTQMPSTNYNGNGGLVQSESSDPMIITGCPLDEHHTATRISPCTLKYENCTPKTNNKQVAVGAGVNVGDPGKMVAKSPPNEHQTTSSSSTHNMALLKLKKKKKSTAKVAAAPSSEEVSPILILPSTTTAMSSSSEIKKTRLAPRSRQRSQSLWGDDATSSSKTSSTEQNQKASIKKIPTAPMLSSLALADEPVSPSTPVLKPKQPHHHHQHHHHTQHQSQSAKVSKSKVKTLSSPSRRRPKPDLLRRHVTAPTPSSSLTSSPTRTKQHHYAPLSHIHQSTTTNVVDDVLTDRAFIIRQNLMNYEMQELALAAEKAANSGLKKFVGNLSKFGVQGKTPEHHRNNPTNKVFNDEDYHLSRHHDSSANSITNNELLMTPSRRKYIEDNITTSSAIISTPAGVVSHAMGMDLQYTPSSSYYFARKKIPVTQLRDFGEIVPNFMEMHMNIRHQLGNKGVDMDVLPEDHGRRSLIKNDTDDTPNVYEEEGGNKGGEEWEALSQAPSIAASHASSFSSYAVASLTSLKEIIEYVNWPRSADNNTSAANHEIRPSMSMPTHASQSKQHQQQHGLRDIEQCTSLRSVPSSQGAVDLIPTVRRTSVHTKPPIHFKPAIVTTNSDDSDDSSVEFYGRRSPINTDLSNQSFASNQTENLGMAPWRQQQHQQHHVIRSAASVSSDIIPTTIRKSALQNRVNSRRKKKNPASVSFETEKASYQALLDRMQSSPNNYNNNSKMKTDTSEDVDQRSCAASLTHIDLDILPSSSNLSTKSTPMANFLSKIQNQFSRTRSNSMELGQKTPKAMDEESKQFVANFFYTSKDSNGILEDEDGGISPSTLKINPEHHSRDPYCLPGGCGANDLISACESATKYADLLFNWVGVKDETKKNANRIIDPNEPSDSAA